MLAVRRRTEPAIKTEAPATPPVATKPDEAERPSFFARLLHRTPEPANELDGAAKHPALRGLAAGRSRDRLAVLGATLAGLLVWTGVAVGATLEEPPPNSVPPAVAEAFEPPPPPQPDAIHRLGSGTVELFYDRDALASRPIVEQHAHAILETFFASGDYEGLAVLLEDARIIPRPLTREDEVLYRRMGEPLPEAPRETGTMKLEIDALRQLARHFADRGLPLDDLAGFARPRGIEVPEAMTPEIAGRFAHAIRTPEVLTAIQGQPSGEHARALYLLRHLSADEISALTERLGVERGPGDDAWITDALIDRFVEELHARVLYLDPMGIDTVRALSGLGRGTEIDADVARVFASLPDFSRQVTNCALGRTQTFVVHPIGIDLKSGAVEYLRLEAAHAFRRMFHEAPPELGLFPRSGYRSNAEQRDLQSTGLAAPVCASNHEDGNSVDIGYAIDGVAYGLDSRRTPQYQWLAHHARDYNIVNDVAHEPWHHTFLG